MEASTNSMLDEVYLLSRSYLETKNKPYQRDFLQHNDFKHRLSILTGQRGVGKTTVIIQYLLQKAKDDLFDKSILYVPADHFVVRNLTLYEIAEQFVQTGGKIIAFDEIHKYSNWSNELKSIYDTFPKLKIIASGSSALEIHKGSHDLTRRAIIYHMEGLSFREYLELNFHIIFSIIQLDDLLKRHEELSNEIIKIIENKNKKILPLFNHYLQIGYYPYFLEIKEIPLYFVTLEQNFHTIIESDLTAIYPSLTGNSIKKIKQLLSFIASTVPFIPQWKKIRTLLEVGDERTLKTYFKYLEDAELIRTISKYSKKMHTIETPEKIYLNNTNQLYAISSESENIGTVRETFFLSMLSHLHKIAIPAAGDFIADGQITFEIGGKNKSFEQIKNEKNAYLACDNIERGIRNKIPLWLFGFLY